MRGDRRIEREKKTLRVMVWMYCRRNHARRGELCGGCAELLKYALERIKRCLYGTEKPICSSCEIHCYRPAKREGIRTVMRFAGPRMFLSHPILALAHLFYKKRRGPVENTHPGSAG